MNVRIIRFLALVLGSIWFFPVSCSTGILAGTLTISRIDSRNIERGEQPHPWFFVAAGTPEAERPFTVVELRDLPKFESSTPKYTFLMPRSSDRIKVNEYTNVSYQVLSSDQETEQTIEVTYSDDDKTIWSRYRATALGIMPLTSRMSHPGYMFQALPIGFVLGLLVYGVGRFLRKRFRATA
jgi:hypothetical protein